MMSSVVIILVAMVTVASCQTNDQTLQPEAHGAGVVEAVLDRISASCVFSDDKLFMRRLAYVESSDGADPDTFRSGYYGGIWQVDEVMFDITQSPAAYSAMFSIITSIRLTFNIDWPSIVWTDLTKPLYSALGARLYIQYQSRSEPNGIPRDIAEQAAFWKRNFRPSGDVNNFISAANKLETGCTNAVGADIIFVIDGSGSIGSKNFNSTKEFMKDVVDGFEVGSDKTRFGVIQFGWYVTREFDLNKYATKSAITSAINNILYYGGGTPTHMALDKVRLEGFLESNGARPLSEGHPRVAILLTDGYSNSASLTIAAASLVHAADITVFAIGVGSNIYINELDAIASNPNCQHQFLLSSFSEIVSLKYAIEKRTCEAPVIMAPSENSTTDGSLPAGSDQNCKIKVPAAGATIQLSTNGGRTKFFTSRATYPSEEFFDQVVLSEPGRPGVLFIPQPPALESEDIVYCNIKGDNYTDTNFSVGVKPGDQDRCKNNDCQNGATCYNTETSFECDCQPGFSGNKCQTDTNECESSPCANGGSCVDLVNGWRCDCAPGFSGPNCETNTNECESSPCANGGSCVDLVNGWRCDCAPGFSGTNCATATVLTHNCGDRNPCTPENASNGKFYFQADDPAKFIQCGPGQCFVMSCPAGLVWDTSALACNWP